MLARGPRLSHYRLGSSRMLAIVGALVASMAVGANAVVATPGALAAATPPAGGTCVVESLPSFVAQGEFENSATVGDVITVSCDPTVYGTNSKIKLTASQLYTRCRNRLEWFIPNPYSRSEGRGVTVALDAAGNATAALLAGPGCAAGESLVSAHLEEEPFATFTTSFSVLPPEPTPPGVFALPATQIEDAGSSGVATIIEAEFTSASEKLVRIGAEELFARCRIAPHLRWIDQTGRETIGTSELTGIQLDNDGNAFVVVIGDSSCAPGSSLIEADLESKPFTTFITPFTIEPPQTGGTSDFTIEKLQQIDGSGFTSSQLIGTVGQSVEYEIVVTNTGRARETFSNFTDAQCDPASLSGGPGSSAVIPGGSTTYTCRRKLIAPGSYVNEATITGTAVAGAPVTRTSNPVVVRVPGELGFTLQKLQRIGGAGTYTTNTLQGLPGQTVEYEIVVTNTGQEALSLSDFSDSHCDAGTVSGGPSEEAVQPGGSTTFVCSRLLTGPGTYVNEATVTGSAADISPLEQTSNVVEVTVASTASPVTPPAPTTQTPTPIVTVADQCPARRLPLRGVVGPKSGAFKAKLQADGISQVTFYLDGHRVARLVAAQARHGAFAVRIDAARLKLGKHTVAVKARLSKTACGTAAGSAPFLRVRAVRKTLGFTGAVRAPGKP